MRVVFVGLSITSSWGNGHATNYRALVAELSARGHEVCFCEWDAPWYAAHRDLPCLEGARLCLYEDLPGLRRQAGDATAAADLVVVGSYVHDGAAVIDWVLEQAGGATAFYDIDTPVTLEAVARGQCEYLRAEQMARFDLYLSFTGGPALERLAERHGVRRPLSFPCLVDPARYRPMPVATCWDLGYLGTYSPDRQGALEELLLSSARAAPERSFVVAGPQYPAEIAWPANVERREHVAPEGHAAFYCAQRFTLSVTRAQMRRLGHSPSVRLFEAAACGVPIVTDPWPGLEEVLEPGREVLVARGRDDVLRHLRDVGEAERRGLGERARARVLAEHTAARRVDLLEDELAARWGSGSWRAAAAGSGS